MKRFLCLVCCAALALGLAGCGSALPLDFEAQGVTALNVYTGGVPAAARQKRLQDPQEIGRVLALLQRVRTGREARPEDLPAGGIGLYFEFELAGGGTALVQLAAGGGAAHTAGGGLCDPLAPPGPAR